MWFLGDLTFTDGVLTPEASWNRVELPDAPDIDWSAEFAAQDDAFSVEEGADAA